MRILLSFLALLFIGNLTAQVDYSYISDRKFDGPENLVGYDFKPYRMEIPNELDEEIDPGDYSFGITLRNLYVDGGDIKGVYTMNNISQTEYGYKLTIVNIRNARIQGHLKIIMNGRLQVKALIFRRTQDDPEIIFHLPELDEDSAAEEEAFFTDLGEQILEHQDSIWGIETFPFLRIHSEQGVQERLQITDSTSISFVEMVTIEEKIKKPKKEKKKKEKKKKDTDNEEVMEEIEETITAETDAMTDSIPAPEVKVKITKTYFMDVRTILTYEDGTTKDETTRYPVKKIVEREDEMAKENEERFQLTIENTKGEDIYLYLTSKRAVSSVEIGNKLYLMRGW